MMKLFWTASIALMLGLPCGIAGAQSPQGAVSLLPAPPSLSSYGSASNVSYSHYNIQPTPASEEGASEAVEISPYDQSVSGDWVSDYSTGCESGYGSGCSDDACYSDACYADACGGCWYGSVGGLIMTRDKVNHRQISFDDTDVAGDVINTRDACMDWQGGIDIMLGRHLGCGWAVEGVYWGIFKDTQEINVYGSAIPGNLNSALDFTDLDPAVGTGNVDAWYNASNRHRLRRSYEFHNLELNMAYNLYGYGSACGSSCGVTCGDGCGSYGSGAYGSCGSSCCGRGLNITLLSGFRYFRFNEDFHYATDDVDGIYGNNNAHEMFYDIDVENNLIGFQLGGRADYQINQCFSFYTNTKVGLYANHMTHHSRVGNGDGAATVNNGPNNNAVFDIRSSEDDVSIMGEIDLGLAYHFSSCWTAKIGYRAVGISGIALTTNQIPTRFADIAGVRDIDSNGSLILHGAYASIQYLW